MNKKTDLEELVKQGLLLKFTDTDEHAKDVANGLYMHTPLYYRTHGGKGVNDIEELDDTYPIWCATFIQNIHNNIALGYDPELGCICELHGDIKNDVIKLMQGDTEFDAMGNYVAIIFKPNEYIGEIIKSLYSFNLKLGGYYYKGWMPAEFGSVSYGKQSQNHPKLFKSDKRYEYQHEFRLRLNMNANKGCENKELNLIKHLNIGYENIGVHKCSDIIDYYEKTGKVVFPIQMV